MWDVVAIRMIRSIVANEEREDAWVYEKDHRQSSSSPVAMYFSGDTMYFTRDSSRSSYEGSNCRCNGISSSSLWQ